jgi:hypothetical protein
LREIFTSSSYGEGLETDRDTPIPRQSLTRQVNHREEKDTLGVGQAQLWNARSVPKQPAFAVACYSALLLASLKAFGSERGTAYASLPKWRRHARRPSCLDLITLLRKEMVEHAELIRALGIELTDRSLTAAAAA